MDLIVCFLASSFQITLRNPSSAGWESGGCMQNVISYAKHVNCFIECLKNFLCPGIGRNFYLHWSKFLPLLVKFLTFIGRNFYLYWSNFWPLLVEISTFIGQNFDLYWSKFLPLLVKILTFIGRNFYLYWSKILTFVGRNFDLYWSKISFFLVKTALWLWNFFDQCFGRNFDQPVRWSKFRPEKFRPMIWSTLVETWSKFGSKFRPIMVEKWPQMY